MKATQIDARTPSSVVGAPGPTGQNQAVRQTQSQRPLTSSPTLYLDVGVYLIPRAYFKECMKGVHIGALEIALAWYFELLISVRLYDIKEFIFACR